jgi:hypothetical protein
MFAGDDIPTEVCGAKYSALSNIDRSLAPLCRYSARVFNLANIADVYNISHIGWRETGCLLTSLNIRFVCWWYPSRPETRKSCLAKCSNWPFSSHEPIIRPHFLRYLIYLRFAMVKGSTHAMWLITLLLTPVKPHAFYPEIGLHILTNPWLYPSSIDPDLSTLC